MNSLCGLAILIIVFIFLLPFVNASPTGISGPAVIEPKYNIGAPWDTIKFGLNITDAEHDIVSVILYYSNETVPKNYVPVPMQLVSGNNRTGNWICQIPPQKNGTTIWYYACIIDSTGEKFCTPGPEHPRRFVIRVPSPKFVITNFIIERVDEKLLTADISVSFYIEWPEDVKSIRILYNNRWWDSGSVLINASRQRFRYSGQVSIKGLHLIGNAEEFPFDKYYLDINFTFLHFRYPFQAKVEFQFYTIDFGTYSDYYMWDYRYKVIIDKGEHSSIINIHIDFTRKMERTYFFTIPTLICFFLLGGSYLLDSDKELRSRLTIYLTIFVFVIGTFTENIRELIPNRVIGVTTAELLLNWLAVYSGIFAISSLFGNLLSKRYKKSYLIADFISIILVLLLFEFWPPVFRIKTPHETRVTTLFEQISNSIYRFLISLGIVFGFLIKLFMLLFQRKD